MTDRTDGDHMADPLDLALQDAAPPAADRAADIIVADLALAVAAAAPAGSGAGQILARRRSRRRRALLSGTIVTTAVAVAAAGYGLGARTGLFGEPGMTENDTSEWLDTSMSDFGDVAAALVPDDVALPAWTDWDAGTGEVVASFEQLPGLVQETGVRASFEFYAQCAWLTEWSLEHAGGERAGAEEAVARYESLIDRPTLAAVDGGGVRDRMREVIARRWLPVMTISSSPRSSPTARPDSPPVPARREAGGEPGRVLRTPGHDPRAARAELPRPPYRPA